MNSCGGFVVGTTSCFTSPGSERQASGVIVGVAGTELGVSVIAAGAVTATVADEETTVWVGALLVLFDGQQPESRERSTT